MQNFEQFQESIRNENTCSVAGNNNSINRIEPDKRLKTLNLGHVRTGNVSEDLFKQSVMQVSLDIPNRL